MLSKTSKKAEAVLRRDPILGPVVRKVGPPRFHEYSKENLLALLIEAIVSQQLSGKAARRIYERVKALGGEGFPDPAFFVKARETSLRKAGLSRAKAASVKDLCRRVASGELELERLRLLPDEEVILGLVEVRGIGLWTAQMFLMFPLERPDVWPTADLGVRKALREVMRLPDVPSPKEAESLGDPWRPYRSFAAWYLWQHLD